MAERRDEFEGEANANWQRRKSQTYSDEHINIKVIAVQNYCVSVSLYVFCMWPYQKTRWKGEEVQDLGRWPPVFFLCLFFGVILVMKKSFQFLLDKTRTRFGFVGKLLFSHWFTYKITYWENCPQLTKMAGDPYILELHFSPERLKE